MTSVSIRSSSPALEGDLSSVEVTVLTDDQSLRCKSEDTSVLLPAQSSQGQSTLGSPSSDDLSEAVEMVISRLRKDLPSLSISTSSSTSSPDDNSHSLPLQQNSTLSMETSKSEVSSLTSYLARAVSFAKRKDPFEGDDDPQSPTNLLRSPSCPATDRSFTPEPAIVTSASFHPTTIHSFRRDQLAADTSHCGTPRVSLDSSFSNMNAVLSINDNLLESQTEKSATPNLDTLSATSSCFSTGDEKDWNAIISSDSSYVLFSNGETQAQVSVRSTDAAEDAAPSIAYMGSRSKSEPFSEADFYSSVSKTSKSDEKKTWNELSQEAIHVHEDLQSRSSSTEGISDRVAAIMSGSQYLVPPNAMSISYSSSSEFLRRSTTSTSRFGSLSSLAESCDESETDGPTMRISLSVQEIIASQDSTNSLAEETQDTEEAVPASCSSVDSNSVRSNGSNGVAEQLFLAGGKLDTLQEEDYLSPLETEPAEATEGKAWSREVFRYPINRRFFNIRRIMFPRKRR